MSIKHLIIIGMPKSGSTTLYKYLQEHPETHLSPNKEINYFISWKHDWHKRKKFRNYIRNVFLETFQNKYLSPIIRMQYMKACQAKKRFMSGEASINYFLEPGIPQRIAAYYPNARLIVMFRNPLDRLQSHFWMNYRQSKTDPDWSFRWESFEQFVIEGNHLASINDYAGNMSRWLKFFRREQFFIINSENFFSETTRTLDRIHHFLGLSDHGYKSIYWETPYADRPASYPPMDNSTRQMLITHFRPQQQSLEAITDVSFPWF